MKKTFTLILLSLSVVKADYWTQKANYPGDGRSRSFSFAIGSKAYVGCGEGSAGITDDFWEYDPVTNIWTQKANFGGGDRWSGVSFSVADFGFAGLGWTNGQLMSDMWKYDPVANTWTQLNNFPPGLRQVFPGFSIDAKGYVGTGRSFNGTLMNDFWEYDPVIDSWTQKANVPGVGRDCALGFSLNGSGYIGGGFDQNVTSLSDIYSYNPAANSWLPIANIPGARGDAASFSIGNFGYVGTGQLLPPFNTVLNDFWQYNPASGLWIQKAVYGGVARDESAFCSVANHGYIGLGGLNGNAYYSDWWEYTTDSTTSIEELPMTNIQFTISPNPANEFIVISYQLSGKEKIEITITDGNGKKVFETQLQVKTSNFKLQTSNFTKGIYFVTVDNACLPDRQGKEKTVRKFIKE